MTCSGKADRSAEVPREKDLSWPMMEAVTNIRASIMLMTCITILAVDFQVCILCKLNLQLLVVHRHEIDRKHDDRVSIVFLSIYAYFQRVVHTSKYFMLFACLPPGISAPIRQDRSVRYGPDGSRSWRDDLRKVKQAMPWNHSGSSYPDARALRDLCPIVGLFNSVFLRDPRPLPLRVVCVIFHSQSGLGSGCRVKRESGHPRPVRSVWRTMLADIASAAVRAWPLAALGLSRLVVIKGVGYQEHVSEYGVHWNFFATLFFMRLVVVPMNRIRPVRFKCFLALVAICVYQWFLAKGGLSDFIVHAPRDTLFAMNREGILGLVGFVAIYYVAEELGSQISAHHQKLKVRVAGSISHAQYCDELM